MSGNSLVKKGLVVAVILLFLGMSVIPSIATMVEKKFTMPTNYDGDTLYVGGDGAGNYTRIQDAIDDASDGDTVFVYNGTYCENVVVDKSIDLIGEDKDTTVIDGSGVDDVVYVSADEVNMTGFTVKNSGNMVIAVFDLNGILINLLVDAGIEIRSNSNSVFGNIIAGYIFIKKSSDNSIFHNKISSINLFNSSNNVISNNNVSNDFIMYYSSGNRIVENNINDRLSLEYSSNYNKIYHNNFIQNAYDKCDNSWYTDYLQGGNFWSDYTGNDYYRGINQDIPGSDGIGDIPYNISGSGNNTDRYPLMSPYGSPFQTLYLGYVDVYFEKEAILHRGGGCGGVLKAIYLNVDTSLDELPLKMVYHYTIEMNYSLRFPFWFAPLVAIGLKIKNYSDYSWESMKLLHRGQGIWYGNVTQDINLNLTGFEKGDELELTVDISVIRIPDLDTPGNNESWEWFLRFIYNIPVLKDTLLHNWLLPILAPYNLMFDSSIIFLRFQ